MPRDYTRLSKRALLEHIARATDEQGKQLTKLDDAVANIAQVVTTEVADLKAKLAAATADDAAATSLAADVQENIDRLDALGAQLQAGDVPAPADPPAGGGDTPPPADQPPAPAEPTGDGLAPGEQPTPA